ncbi:unnamed protein product, partial [Urochloa humidicola]
VSLPQPPSTPSPSSFGRPSLPPDARPREEVRRVAQVQAEGGDGAGGASRGGDAAGGAGPGRGRRSWSGSGTCTTASSTYTSSRAHLLLSQPPPPSPSPPLASAPSAKGAHHGGCCGGRNGCLRQGRRGTGRGRGIDGGHGVPGGGQESARHPLRARGPQGPPRVLTRSDLEAHAGSKLVQSSLKFFFCTSSLRSCARLTRVRLVSW